MKRLQLFSASFAFLIPAPISAADLDASVSVSDGTPSVASQAPDGSAATFLFDRFFVGHGSGQSKEKSASILFTPPKAPAPYDVLLNVRGFSVGMVGTRVTLTVKREGRSDRFRFGSRSDGDFTRDLRIKMKGVGSMPISLTLKSVQWFKRSNGVSAGIDSVDVVFK